MPMLARLLVAVVPARIATAPHIDGHLDDKTWSGVPATDQNAKAMKQ